MAQLANIERTVDHDLDTIWKWLSNFGEIGWTGADDVDVIGEGVGMTRRINMEGLPEPIDEVLESMDHDKHSFSYTIPRGLPLPLDDYRAVVECSDAGDGKTLINWQCHAKPGEGVSEEDAKAIISGTYDSLITGLVTAIEAS